MGQRVGEAAVLSQACLRLKIVPDQWLVEIFCPVSKSGSPVCRTDDLRPIKLLEVAKKAVLSIVKVRCPSQATRG